MFGSQIMEFIKAIGLLGIAIYAVSLCIIWRSYRNLNDTEKNSTKSINREIGGKLGKYLIILMVCLIVGVIALNRYSSYFYSVFFFLCMIAQAYQYSRLKSYLLHFDLPKNYISNTLRSNLMLTVGLALIVISFLLTAF
jgi:hypothetical protein